MNSLQTICLTARKAVIAITIISSLTLVAAAQRVQPQQQGRMYGEPGFVGEPINLKVVNADIRDILNYITEQYGVNFVIDNSVKAVPVTVNVSDVPWNLALDSILAAQDLGIQVNGPILRVASKAVLAADYEKNLKIQESQVYVGPLVTQFVRLNYARAKGSLVRGVSTSGTTTSPTGTENPYGPIFAPAVQAGTGAGSTTATQSSGGAGLLPIIQRRLSKRGSIEVDERTNSLIITDVRENVDRILQLIAVLDQPEPQVEIEARIVVATRNFSRDVGVQLSGMVTGPNGRLGQGGTLPAPQQSGDTNLRGGVNTQPNNNLFSSIPNTVIGLTTGIFGTAQINLLISAGEQKGQAKIIATPRVTALNNEKAKIESKTQIPITTIQPGGTGGAPIATTTYVDVPLKLEITPQITDVGTVVLDVVAENSSTSTIVTGANPAINNQNMSTRVTVPDGGTTVVGGVLFDDERENQDRTPGLSRIPLLGNLFKRKGVQRNTNEILFFITPRISRPEYSNEPGKSGVITSATFVQPVPLGNPPSNSEQKPSTTVVPVGPVIQPEATPIKPNN